MKTVDFSETIAACDLTVDIGEVGSSAVAQ